MKVESKGSQPKSNFISAELGNFRESDVELDGGSHAVHGRQNMQRLWRSFHECATTWLMDPLHSPKTTFCHLEHSNLLNLICTFRWNSSFC